MISELEAIKTATLAYYTDTGKWPPSCGMRCFRFNNLTQNRFLVSQWDGPYLERWPQPPWGGGCVYGLGASPGGTLFYQTPPLIPSSEVYAFVSREFKRVDIIQKIDDKIDDGNLETGLVRYPSYMLLNRSLLYLIYRDGPVD